MKMHIFTFMAVLLVGSIGCDVKQKINTRTRTKQIAKDVDSTKYILLDESKIQSISLNDTSQYAIFPVKYAQPFLGEAQQITLNKKEILVIERAIRKSITLYNDRKGTLSINLKKYKRQYFPGITAFKHCTLITMFLSINQPH